MDNNKTVENGNVKIVKPNKGRHIAVAGDINTIVVSYSFIEAKVFPGGGPAPHIQTREHEGFYVVEGQLTFKVDKQRIEHYKIYFQLAAFIILKFQLCSTHNNCTG